MIELFGRSWNHIYPAVYNPAKVEQSIKEKKEEGNQFKCRTFKPYNLVEPKPYRVAKPMPNVGKAVDVYV